MRMTSVRFARLRPFILDEIDRTLVRHHGSTEEGLDFIINYDLSYRLSRESEAEDARS
jgi:hypothetical protein